LLILFKRTATNWIWKEKSKPHYGVRSGKRTKPETVSADDAAWRHRSRGTVRVRLIRLPRVRLKTIKSALAAENEQSVQLVACETEMDAEDIRVQHTTVIRQKAPCNGLLRKSTSATYTTEM